MHVRAPLHCVVALHAPRPGTGGRGAGLPFARSSRHLVVLVGCTLDPWCLSSTGIVKTMRVVVLLVAVWALALPPRGEAKKPHLIYVIGDDVGWFKMGWHNPDARTPNLDALVKEGVELDRFYTYKYCSPTRSSFLSGRLPIHNTQINM